MFGRLPPDPVARVHTLVDLAERAVPFFQDEDRESFELEVLAARVEALATAIRMDVRALAAQAEAAAPADHVDENAPALEEELLGPPDYLLSGAYVEPAPGQLHDEF